MVVMENVVVQVVETVDSCWVPLNKVSEMLALMPN
jgi:hypothetical protein